MFLGFVPSIEMMTRHAVGSPVKPIDNLQIGAPLREQTRHFLFEPVGQPYKTCTAVDERECQ